MSDDDERNTLRQARERLFAVLSALKDRSGPAARGASSVMRTFRFKAAVAGFVLLVGAGLLVRAMLGWFGPVDTVIYVLAFGIAATAVPLLVLFFGSIMPLSTGLGKLHLILAHVAYRYPYLLDVGDRWEYAPGKEDQVWIDGRYYDIVSGQENRSVLGWRPFGIVLDKTRVKLKEARRDIEALQMTDGGSVERAGYEERVPPKSRLNRTDWLLDLKRVFSRGVKRFADIDIIETTEEVTQREESQTGSFTMFRGIIGVLLGFAVGATATYAMLGGV